MTREQLWESLGRVRTLAFVARSATPSGWNGRGSGAVIVAPDKGDAITFTESGTWRPDGGPELRFTNVFRWTPLDSGNVRLEHLRFGPAHPVYLFDLAPAPGGEWHSVAPHVCREDCYTARLRAEGGQILLSWSVTGPARQQRIDYLYA